MHWHSIDYRKRDGAKPGTPFDRGFWLHLPRAMPLCRLVGHRAVVDGTTGFGPDDPGSRWVCCDRCGTRPDPQGHLDPARWNIGDPYDDERAPEPHHPLGRPTRATSEVPGPWRTSPEGVIGGQVVVGKTFGGIGIDLKLGHAGSEHTLAASITLNPLGAVYIHTEGYGTWLQRRLNPTGYHPKRIEFRTYKGSVYWTLGTDRDSYSKGDPRWRHGSTVIDPRDRILGPRRHTYDKVGDPVTATVRMPHGDDHGVTLQLERCTTGRARGRKTTSWSVDWESNGIPYKPDGTGRYTGSAVTVSDRSVQAGTWPHHATAAIAASITTSRDRHRWPVPTAAVEAPA
ncbi:hypothetical protein B4N89_27790 [Embleya scabrispora]|uniref:Uncharacterized protein n=1 Tax=Embleya scabrispora TaxID=159449 RepID=A0A1T3P5K7_9ACTN|nr:hypothetical protein [Embleya scabrispora]OPC84225.1 hypothetical protein B4N89_27790 [Embleya scabrispora]